MARVQSYIVGAGLAPALVLACTHPGPSKIFTSPSSYHQLTKPNMKPKNTQKFLLITLETYSNPLLYFDVYNNIEESADN